MCVDLLTGGGIRERGEEGNFAPTNQPEQEGGADIRSHSRTLPRRLQTDFELAHNSNSRSSQGFLCICVD